MTYYMIGDPQNPRPPDLPATRSSLGGNSSASGPLAPYSMLNPPPTLTTPLAVDIPVLPPGELERLSVEYSQTRDIQLRERLVIYHQRLVRSIASRFVSMGEAIEDLIQVGNIGLINALDRYDPGQGTRFSTYATPTILGEIKRYFRDKTAAIKVPRWMQELSHQIRHTSHALTHELARVPTPAEIAIRLNITEEEVLQAMESGEASNPLSLNAQFDGASESASLFELIGRPDDGLLEFESFGDLRSALATLQPRERDVISLRFFEEMSQAKIAKQLNISQMHVSRLQQRALKRLHDLLSEQDAANPKRNKNRRAS